MKFHQDGKRLVIADSTHYLKFFDIESQKSLTEMWTVHQSKIAAFNFSSDGKFLASCGLDNIVNYPCRFSCTIWKP